MTEKHDVYSYFWDNKFGINVNQLDKIDKEEISWKAKLVKLNKNKNKAKEKYLSWFKNDNGKIIPISLNRKYNFLKELLLNYKSIIPKYSCLIDIHFKLKKPYMSKDDDEFYIIDNPIVKDKVFKVPMIRASTWKGALRYAAIKVFEEGFNKNDWKSLRLRIYKLFGNEKGIDSEESKYLDRIIAEKVKAKEEDVKKEFKNYLQKEIGSVYFKGRLSFYPTFFDKISLDIITPLSRETKTPTRGPIYFETVPEETTGVLRIFYYPYDLIAKGEFDNIKTEIVGDIELLSQAVCKAFYEIGVSAKKTSGYGAMEIVDEKDIEIKCEGFDKHIAEEIHKEFKEKLLNGDR